MSTQAEAKIKPASPSGFFCSTQTNPQALRTLHQPGMEVPRATNTTAVTESLRPIVHPKWEARSPVKAVRTPMSEIDTKKQAQPFQYSVGGTNAKSTFQKTVRKCMM